MKLGAFAGIVLVPFGSVSELGSVGKPWHGFHATDPVLNVVRVETIQDPRPAACRKWVEALNSLSHGSFVGMNPETADWKSVWKQWKPWTEDDREAVADCDSFPCKVKLNREEVKRMTQAGSQGEGKETDGLQKARQEVAKEPKKEITPKVIQEIIGVETEEWKRFAVYFNLVETRAREYLKSQKRSHYEYPGNPVDPWEIFGKRGFKGLLTRPGQSQLLIRRMDFDSERMRPIRQVLDRRIAMTGPREKKQASSLWIRDLYTAHYFDSWGEWAYIECEPGRGEIRVLQTLVVELDLLKKGDLLSRIARGKMRSGVKEMGGKYLDQHFAELRRLAK